MCIRMVYLSRGGDFFSSAPMQVYFGGVAECYECSAPKSTEEVVSEMLRYQDR